jgi:hypothetical protein
MSPSDERSACLKCCLLIDEASSTLRLPLPTSLTAKHFLRRFFAAQRYQDHSRFQLTACCQFLSCKVEETPRKVQLVLATCCNLLHAHAHAVDPPAPLPFDVPFDLAGPSPVCDPKSKPFQKLKEEVIARERILLHTLSFDLSVGHAKDHVVVAAKALHARAEALARQTGEPAAPGCDASAQRLAQYALGAINDAAYSAASLGLPEAELAKAAVAFAAVQLGLADPAMLGGSGRHAGPRRFYELLGAEPGTLGRFMEALEGVHEAGRTWT